MINQSIFTRVREWTDCQSRRPGRQTTRQKDRLTEKKRIHKHFLSMLGKIIKYILNEKDFYLRKDCKQLNKKSRVYDFCSSGDFSFC